MSAATTILALEVLDSLLSRAASVNGTILTARKEGREVSEAELDTAVSGDDATRAILEASIARAKAEGR